MDEVLVLYWGVMIFVVRPLEVGGVSPDNVLVD